VPYSDGKGNTFIRTFAGAVVYTEEEKYQKIDFEDMAEEDLKVKYCARRGCNLRMFAIDL
jgi:YidC/Oxa1 family membrane protein insertase